ncbi:MAG: hypothetical protein M3O50_17365 [Myxococcota bacterium]|nr:hypothetical protein [Myxococcota bacterium]
MTRCHLHALATAFLVHAGCTKPLTNGIPDAAAPPATSAAVGAPATVATSDATPPRTGTSSGPTRARDWRGTYTSQTASVYVPPDWKNVHWKGAETSQGLGQGSMAIAIDARSGHVTGTLEGPLGPAWIDGVSIDDKLTATIIRKDPADHGFVGTLVGGFTTARAEGTMNAALWDASALRTAAFTLSSDPSK